MKTKAKVSHTPGPWEASEAGVIAERITSYGNFYVCSTIDADNDEHKANMRLCAAAPDLLEACRGLLNMLQEYDAQKAAGFKDAPHGWDAWNAVHVARASIAKAEGRE